MHPLRVVIAEGTPGIRDGVLPAVEAAGFELVGEAVEWDRVAELVASRAADLVCVCGDPDYAAGISILGGAVATMIFTPDARAAKEYAGTGAFAVVTPSLEPDVVAAVGVMIVARAADLKAARSEAETLREQLESRKLVERAKGVLMRKLGIPEEAAYRRMQKASQDENRKLKQIAESILSAEKLLEADKPSQGSEA